MVELQLLYAICDMPYAFFSVMIGINNILNCDVKAASSLIRDIEDEKDGTDEILAKLYPHTGNAQIIGITGPSGSGKSTLISGLIREFVNKKKRIGVLCIDPTSPFSGGAFLGDRIRMKEHFLNKNVFVRSIAGREGGKGLNKSIIDIIRVVEAMGKDIIFVETIGTGQDEIEIGKIVDTVVLVLAPGAGDDIQALKAGILEIADILVVNKKDKEEASILCDIIKNTLNRDIFLVDSLKREGIEELAKRILKSHKKKDFLRYEIDLKIKERVNKEINRKLSKRIKATIKSKRNPYELYNNLIRKLKIEI